MAQDVKRVKISWTVLSDQVVAQFEGHHLKINPREDGRFEAQIDGNHVAPVFAFDTMSQAMTACSQAVMPKP